MSSDQQPLPEQRVSADEVRRWNQDDVAGRLPSEHISPVAHATSAAWKARRLWPSGVEALVISRQDDGDFRIDVNLGHADDLVAGDLDYVTALGIAHALDVVYGCGVYEDGNRL